MDEFYGCKRVIGVKFDSKARRTILTLEGGQTVVTSEGKVLFPCPKSIHLVASLILGLVVGFGLGICFQVLVLTLFPVFK
ncbi:MAG TPA: hypothetical protein VHG71_06600 [Verrucomicrobiae bacterium]|nr:hypothetical protein [Verrucomicrobiae bacterium]